MRDKKEPEEVKEPLSSMEIIESRLELIEAVADELAELNARLTQIEALIKQKGK